jgi:FKBP-type peptidyl-prolyl cis-trans isomerase (trigger factor)
MISQHVFQLNVSAGEVDRAVEERLAAMAKSVRLPGFRAGKIPAAVLHQRYGAQARSEAIKRLILDTVGKEVPAGHIVGAIEVKSGVEHGDVAFHVTATYLPDLPDFDASQVEIERLTATDDDLAAAGVSADLLRNHLHQQVLDRLHETYPFGLHPTLIDREFEAIWKAARAQGATESLAPEFRAIAERRVRLGAIVAEMARRYQIRAQPIEDNVIDYFLAQARVTERRVGVDELRDLAEG